MEHRTHLISHQHQVLICAKLDQLLQVLLGQALPSWVARVDENKSTHLHHSGGGGWHTLLVAISRSSHTSSQHPFVDIES